MEHQQNMFAGWNQNVHSGWPPNTFPARQPPPPNASQPPPPNAWPPYPPSEQPRSEPTILQQPPPNAWQTNPRSDLPRSEPIVLQHCDRCKDLREEVEKSQKDIIKLRRKCWVLDVERFKTVRPREGCQNDGTDVLYNELIKEAEILRMGELHKDKLLGLRNAYIQKLIEQNNCQRAEEVAKETWEKWGQEDNDDSRLTYRLGCSALRHQGAEKYEALEGWLRKTWPNPGEEHQSRPLWTMENGDELCLVLELQGESVGANCFEKALALRKELWEKRKEMQGAKHNDTVQSGVWAAQCCLKHVAKLEEEPALPHRINYLKQEAMENFKEIWSLWDPKEQSEADLAILTAGHTLGNFHYSQGVYSEARLILEVVWEGRKRGFLQGPNDALLTSYYLSLTCLQLGDYSKAKSLLEEVWNARKILLGETSEETVLAGYYLSLTYGRLGNYLMAESTSKWVWEIRDRGLGPKDPKTLNARYYMGWALLKQKRYQDAESILNEVYEAYSDISEPRRYQKDRLTCGHYLGEARAKQPGKCREAVNIMKEVFGKQDLDSNPLEVLESGHLYGCLLMELEHSQDGNRQLLQAEDVKDKMAGLERVGKPECDRCLVFGLAKHRRADEALRHLWTLKKKDGEKHGILVFGRCLGISLMIWRNYERATEIFRDMWAVPETQQCWSSVAECGLYLAVCLEEQQQHQESQRVLDEIEGKRDPGGINTPTKRNEKLHRTETEKKNKHLRRRRER